VPVRVKPRGAFEESRSNANSIIESQTARVPLIRKLARVGLARRAVRPPGDRRNPRYADGMPETRIERFIFGVGALAIAALVALIVLEMTDRFGTHQTHAATRRAATPAATTTAENTTASETRAETTVAAESPRPPSGITLRLRAKADTWVEIRAGSANGDVLYSGILPQGNAKRFEGMKVWASFGAASNLTARLNGKPLPLPPGTYAALVTTRGLRPLY
jgi:Domain of unknown function (DUF4115)